MVRWAGSSGWKEVALGAGVGQMRRHSIALGRVWWCPPGCDWEVQSWVGEPRVWLRLLLTARSGGGWLCRGGAL